MAKLEYDAKLSEFEFVLSGTIDGVPFAGVAWPRQKTLVLATPPGNDLSNTFGYVREILAEVKWQVVKNGFWRLLPLRWEIYACYEGKLCRVDMRKKRAYPVLHFRDGDIGDYVERELEKQMAALQQ